MGGHFPPPLLVAVYGLYRSAQKLGHLLLGLVEFLA
jgi:hypothetical protein